MGLFYTKQLRDFWQTTFPTIVGFGTRMQFIIKSEILDGKKKIKMHHSLLAVTVAWATVGLSAAGLM